MNIEYPKILGISADLKQMIYMHMSGKSVPDYQEEVAHSHGHEENQVEIKDAFEDGTDVASVVFVKHVVDDELCGREKVVSNADVEDSLVD